MYLGTEFVRKFPTIDDITSRIMQLQGKCVLYKISLQRAFRHLKLDPRDIKYTRLLFDDKYYVDTSVPFGYIDMAVCVCKRMPFGR